MQKEKSARQPSGMSRRKSLCVRRFPQSATRICAVSPCFGIVSSRARWRNPLDHRVEIGRPTPGTDQRLRTIATIAGVPAGMIVGTIVGISAAVTVAPTGRPSALAGMPDQMPDRMTTATTGAEVSEEDRPGKIARATPEPVGTGLHTSRPVRLAVRLTVRPTMTGDHFGAIGPKVQRETTVLATTGAAGLPSGGDVRAEAGKVLAGKVVAGKAVAGKAVAVRGPSVPVRARAVMTVELRVSLREREQDVPPATQVVPRESDPDPRAAGAGVVRGVVRTLPPAAAGNTEPRP